MPAFEWVHVHSISKGMISLSPPTICNSALNTVELATLARRWRRGVNPLTHKRVLQADNVPYILAEMMMEGLYGRSGDWAYRVGLPGKSGVGGGILAVVPGVMGIAAFSPPLDEEQQCSRSKMVASVAKQLGYNVFKG